ncbi:MAG: hypothetical protein HUJ60_01870, partial [Bacilli bacterium]|nr:hypothetical protein [Bacilli bacterium]
MAKVTLKKLSSIMGEPNPEIEREALAFLHRIDPDGEIEFVEEEGGLPIYFLLTGGSEIKFKAIFEKEATPYLILPLGTRNSFAASLEIVSFLNDRGLPNVLLYGEPREIKKQILDYALAYEAKKKLNGMRLGLIGPASDWLISSRCDPALVKAKLGIEIVPIPMEELIEAVEKHEILDEAAYKEALAKTDRVEKLKETFYIYSGLSRLVERYNLQGFTLRCFDLLLKYQNTSCLAFGYFNSRGILAGCEGDVPSLLSMALAQAITGQPSFMANPERFDFATKEAVYAHCTCPLSMLDRYELMTHFESDQGFGIRGDFHLGQMTMLKIAPKLDRIVVKRLRNLDNLKETDICRSQIKVAFDEAIEDLRDKPAGNHMIFVYGD